jgi:hypothetical protein
MTSVLLRRAALALLVIAGAVLPASDWLRPDRLRADPERLALRRFLEHLRTETRPGDTVALAVPASLQDSGYLRYRAQYLLPGRKVILGDDARAAVIASFPNGAVRRR